MCGRYELHTHPAAMALAFGIPIPPDIEPRYNTAPSRPRRARLRRLRCRQFGRTLQGVVSSSGGAVEQMRKVLARMGGLHCS